MTSSEPWSSEETLSLPLTYRCELLFHNITSSELNDRNLPSDSFLVYYQDKEGNKIDICRGSRMVDVFDLYYDRFGPAIKTIEFTKGRVNPKVWGQNKKKAEEGSKKK